MAVTTWYARNAFDPATGVWKGENQTRQAGPVAIISATIPAINGNLDATSKTPITLTASATINDSLGNPIPSGLLVLVIRNDTKEKVAEVTSGANGAVSYTATMVPPHPDYLFVVPQQTNWPTETLCSAPVTPV